MKKHPPLHVLMKLESKIWVRCYYKDINMAKISNIHNPNTDKRTTVHWKREWKLIYQVENVFLEGKHGFTIQSSNWVLVVY
jgi:hypothetical protein